MRRFLFLQGPHGPIFARLASRLVDTGAEVARVGFNAGDEFFWPGRHRYLPCRESLSEWPDRIGALLDDGGFTDLVCYGSSRPVHRIARAAAAARGLRVHVFEEGYLRPYWITYERGGANADSPLMRLSVAEMARALSGNRTALRPAPDRWGDLRQHMFWGAAYHLALVLGRGRYPAFRSHRSPDPEKEFLLHVRRLAEMPLRRFRRRIAMAELVRGGHPYHVVLLQLAHDANFRDNSPFDSQESFLDLVLRGFARGAPRHHHLVVKAHPLEDGREPLSPLVRRLAGHHGLSDRVHFIGGGKLAGLLDHANSAVTVNSTSAEQVLWRGLPLKALGRAVFNRPEFVSDQSLESFFASPRRPDTGAYAVYRAFLLATSQIPGGFYSARGRSSLLRQLPDLMLRAHDPYTELTNRDAAAPQHIRLAKASEG